MKIKILGLLALLTLGCAGMVMGQSITVDHVDGVTTENTTQLMATGQDIVFHIRMADPDSSHRGLTNAWRIYSPTDAQWTTTAIVATDALTTSAPGGGGDFDLFYSVFHRSITGSGSDTVAIAAAIMMSPVGMPAGFDSITHTITIGPIDAGYDGGQLCIDSTWYPSGIWKWAGADVFPSWGGPYCYLIDADGTDVSRLGDNLPTEWSLGQNYPNPFNPTTEIAFDVPSRSHVTLAVYNVLGQHVTNLVDDTYAPGHYSADWDGTSQGGGSVASGVYFYRLETEDYIETKKMMLLK